MFQRHSELLSAQLLDRPVRSSAEEFRVLAMRPIFALSQAPVPPCSVFCDELNPEFREAVPTYAERLQASILIQPGGFGQIEKSVHP